MSRHRIRLVAAAGACSLAGLLAACAMPGPIMTGPAPAGPAPGSMFMPGPGWQRGVRAYRLAMIMRRRRGAPVFLFFYRPSCPYSRGLQRFYFHDPRFLRGTAGITRVMINTRGSAAEQTLASRLGVTGTPELLIFPGRGGRARKMLIYYYVGRQVRRKPMAQVLSEIRRKAFGR